MLGIKRVENRSVMPVPGKGRCAVSCSKKFCKEEYGAFVQWASVNLPTEDFARVPAWADVKDWPGKVIGCCEHNHPSGNPMPSVQDRQMTAALEELGERLNVKVLDHLVLGDATHRIQN